MTKFFSTEVRQSVINQEEEIEDDTRSDDSIVTYKIDKFRATEVR